MSAGQNVGPLDREARRLFQPPLPPDEATWALAAAAGISTVGLRPSFVIPAAAHSHPDCRAVLILIVAPQWPLYAGKKGWTLPYRRWLTTVRFDHPAQQVVLQDYIHSVYDAEERIARLTKQIEDLVPTWSMAPVVEAFQGRCHVIETTTRSGVAVRNFKRPRRPRATYSSPRCVARGVIELT